MFIVAVQGSCLTACRKKPTLVALHRLPALVPSDSETLSNRPCPRLSFDSLAGKPRRQKRPPPGHAEGGGPRWPSRGTRCSWRCSSPWGSPRAWPRAWPRASPRARRGPSGERLRREMTAALKSHGLDRPWNAKVPQRHRPTFVVPALGPWISRSVLKCWFRVQAHVAVTAWNRLWQKTTQNELGKPQVEQLFKVA